MPGHRPWALWSAYRRLPDRISSSYDGLPTACEKHWGGRLDPQTEGVASFVYAARAKAAWLLRGAKLKALPLLALVFLRLINEVDAPRPAILGQPAPSKPIIP